MSYPNPSVLNYGLMLDGKATFVLGSAVAYSSLVPVEGGGGAPVMTTNVAHRFNNGIAIASPVGATLNVPLNASTSVEASLNLQSAGATRWNLLRADMTDDFYLQRATGTAGSEAIENLVRILNSNGYIGIKTQSLEVPSSFLHVNASFATAITTKSSDYTLTDNDHTLLGNAKGGAFTLTLPAASAATGRIYILKKIDSTLNGLVIQAGRSDKIDETLSQMVLILPHQVVALQSDGVGWWRITN